MLFSAKNVFKSDIRRKKFLINFKRWYPTRNRVEQGGGRHIFLFFLFFSKNHIYLNKKNKKNKKTKKTKKTKKNKKNKKKQKLIR